MKRIAVVVALMLGAMFPATGRAADSVVAVVAPFRYSPEPIQITRGATLTFANLDPISGEGHSLTHAVASGAEQFKTPIIPPGTTAPVAGVETLQPGQYRFTCRVHGFMRGVLEVV